MKKVKKLILVGASKDSVHLKNYYNLVKNCFDDILILTNSTIDYCNFKIIDFSLNKPLKIVKSIKIVRQIIFDYNPSIIHIHQANSYAYITLKANQKKIPTVLTTWGSDVLILPNKGGVYKYIVKFNLKTANYITADAVYMSNSIQKLIGKKEVLIANFGINYNEIKIPIKENIIYSNRLHNKLYNIDKIIAGFYEFLKQNPDWKLILGGNGRLTKELKELAKSILPKESYEFVGFVDAEKNQEYYLRSKIWVSIPSSDGTAISLLEAMGYGCIPVVSDLPANLEWINSGENGIVVSNSVQQSFRNALLLDIEKIQQKNKTLILNKATKEVNNKKFVSIYNKIIG